MSWGFLVLDTDTNKFNWTNLSETEAPAAEQAPELVVDMQHVSAVLTELVLTGNFIKTLKQIDIYLFIK